MEKLSLDIPDKIIDIQISAVNRIDGLKLILKDGGWLLIRPSGTEPLLRIYGESTDEEKLTTILKQGKNLVIKVLREKARKLR